MALSFAITGTLPAVLGRYSMVYASTKYWKSIRPFALVEAAVVRFTVA
jgi:hypothetical protein